MWAADIVKRNGKRITIGHYKRENQALHARYKYYRDLEQRKVMLRHRQEFPELYEGSDQRNASDPPMPSSPRAILRIGLSPRAHKEHRDSHVMLNIPQEYRDSNQRKAEMKKLNFKRYHHKRHGLNIIPEMVRLDLQREAAKKKSAERNADIQPYHPLYRKESNNINIHLMERQQKLVRERTINNTYNNVFRRQHAWHPYTFKVREQHESAYGHEGEIDDNSVPSKHKNYVRNHSHVNIFQPNEMKDHEIYHENLYRRMKGEKLKLGDTRVIHAHNTSRPPTPPTLWPTGSNRSGRVNYEKLKGYK